MLNLDFLEKGLGIVFPPHFVYDVSRKMFLMLYAINWPNLIVWLSLLLGILINMFIAHKFRIQPYLQAVFRHDQKFKTKFKYLENERSF